jgi:hypothetical protein
MKRAELYARQFLLAGRSGQVFTNLWLLGQILMQLNVSKVAPLVTSPTLITQYRPDGAADPQPGRLRLAGRHVVTADDADTA